MAYGIGRDRQQRAYRKCGDYGMENSKLAVKVRQVNFGKWRVKLVSD